MFQKSISDWRFRRSFKKKKKKKKKLAAFAKQTIGTQLGKQKLTLKLNQRKLHHLR